MPGQVEVASGPAAVDPLTLHTAARRWLMDRYAELTREYSTLPHAGRTEDGSYRPEALRLFPRYQVVAAVLAQVERLDPDTLPPLPALVDALVEAAGAAESPFTRPDGDEVRAAAMAAERSLFRSMVHRWLAGGELPAEPLPYRRVLTPAESAGLQERLRHRWGLVDRMWHPLVAAPVSPDVLVLAADAMWDERGLARVRQALREMGGRRVCELYEDGVDYLVDLELFAPRYTACEGVWCDDRLSWIAYASHEGTVAFGGDLAAALRRTWGGLDRWRWSPDPPA